VRRFERARDDLEQGGFARAVGADDARGGPGLQLKADIAQGPELAVPLPAPARQRLLEAVARVVIDAVLLGNIFDA